TPITHASIPRARSPAASPAQHQAPSSITLSRHPARRVHSALKSRGPCSRPYFSGSSPRKSPAPIPPLLMLGRLPRPMSLLAFAHFHASNLVPARLFLPCIRLHPASHSQCIQPQAEITPSHSSTSPMPVPIPVPAPGPPSSPRHPPRQHSPPRRLQLAPP